ncbi:LysR family transcriptional regulator [Mycetohabitans sp. B46]|uniref:LysR family transcriptional regulator n=1 Tax=Mycetohabitans sp. B46 TaxID=2772536 RepID=UPI00307EFB36
MDTLVSMKVFRHVVEAGSFATAAERMHLSPAMASKHVMHLEAHLGARLLNRTTRRISLTEAGRDYYERCVQALTELEEAEQAVSEASVVPKGTLRINALSTFGNRYLMPAIAEYTRQHPGVQVDITMSDRVVDLVEEGYDLAIRGSRSAKLRSSSLIARQIARAYFVICASPDYLRRHGVPQVPEDLRAHNCLRLAAHGAHTREWPLGNAENGSGVTTRGNIVANDIEALRAAAIAGAGIAYLGTDCVHDDLENGTLVPLLLEHVGPRELPIFVVYPSRRHLSAKVRSFVDFIAERFAGDAYWPTREHVTRLAARDAATCQQAGGDTTSRATTQASRGRLGTRP